MSNRIPDEVLADSKIIIHVEFECEELPDADDVLHNLRRVDIGRLRKVHMIREKDGKVVQTVHGGVTWEGDNLKQLMRR